MSEKEKPPFSELELESLHNTREKTRNRIIKEGLNIASFGINPFKEMVKQIIISNNYPFKLARLVKFEKAPDYGTQNPIEIEFHASNYDQRIFSQFQAFLNIFCNEIEEKNYHLNFLNQTFPIGDYYHKHVLNANFDRGEIRFTIEIKKPFIDHDEDSAYHLALEANERYYRNKRYQESCANQENDDQIMIYPPSAPVHNHILVTKIQFYEGLAKLKKI